MRTVLLASAAVLALSVTSAMAGNAGSGGFINKSANSQGGSNAASTGGTAGNHDGNTSTNTLVNVHKNLSSSASTNSASATTGGTALNHSANNDPIASGNTVASGNTKSTSIDKSSSAGGGSGGAASATTGGVAVNKDNGNLTSLLSGNSTTIETDTSLSNSSTHVHVTLADSSVTGTANNGVGGHGFLGGGNVMTNSVNGQGILTAQQNTGGGAVQQNSVALGSVVMGSTLSFSNTH